MLSSVIVINGQEHTWTSRFISYADIARIVDVREPTVVVREPFGADRGRSLIPGKSLAVDNGMIIEAVNTGAA